MKIGLRRWWVAVLGAVLVGVGMGGAQDAPAEAPSYDPGLKVTVGTRYGIKVTLLGPETHFNPTPSSYEMEWKLTTVAPSPEDEQKFTLVHYIGTMPKYWDAAVYLVNNKGVVIRLSEDKVWSVSWTNDGKYILRFGDNTLRVWNTAGGRRQVNFSQDDYRTVNDKVFCSVERTEDGTGRHYVVKRYSIPDLKLLSRIKIDQDYTCDP
jgi:WD40 repeat protein